MANPVGRLARLLTHERSNQRQVIAGIGSNTVVLPVTVARRQAVAAHFRDPHVEAGAGEKGTQANTFGRIPETAVGKTAVQENDRHTLGLVMVGQPQAGQGQFDAGVRAVAGLDPVHVFAEVTAAFGTEQGHGE
ncbi:hypothetical protein D9M71_706050 [compost metagenome]